MASLLAELATLKPERAPRYREQIASLAGGALFEVDFGNVYAVASLVNKTLIYRGVAGEYLFYPDCPPETPFC